MLAYFTVHPSTLSSGVILGRTRVFCHCVLLFRCLNLQSAIIKRSTGFDFPSYPLVHSLTGRLLASIMKGFHFRFTISFVKIL